MTTGTANRHPTGPETSASGASELLREVNERIHEVEHGRATGVYDLVCECGDETCTAVMRIPADDYEAVRSEQGAFAVLPGHELADDIVLRSGDGYVVIRLSGHASASPPRG